MLTSQSWLGLVLQLCQQQRHCSTAYGSHLLCYFLHAASCEDPSTMRYHSPPVFSTKRCISVLAKVAGVHVRKDHTSQAPDVGVDCILVQTFSHQVVHKILCNLDRRSLIVEYRRAQVQAEQLLQ